jgi:hypothetical protein
MLVKNAIFIVVLFVSVLTISPSEKFAEPANRAIDKPTISYRFHQQSIPDIFRWIKRLFGIKRKPIEEYQAFVVDMNLDRVEVLQNCGNGASDAQRIRVSTTIDNRYADVLTYHYAVSGGRVVDASANEDKKRFWFPEGKGETAIWDLSDAEPGTYTITAGVDDGCGICGKTVTKEVSVLPCQ